MPKVFNIITNLSNGAGLERDYKLLRGKLEAYDHKVNGCQFNSYDGHPKADVNIFLETIAGHIIPNAPENWLIPNSEWFFPYWNQLLPQFSRVLCKTKNGLHIWQDYTRKYAAAEHSRTHRNIVMPSVQLLGWEAVDFYDPTIPRERRFLHLAGKSMTKNTESVMAAWRVLPEVPLTFVASREEVLVHKLDAPNVTTVSNISDDEVKRLLNSHLFHIMPSQQEGFGMVLHEAVGCGAVVLTTDAPSMNEIAGINKDMLIPVCRKQPLRIDVGNFVSKDHIMQTVYRALELSDQRVHEIQNDAREGFLAERFHFNQLFGELMDEL